MIVHEFIIAFLLYFITKIKCEDVLGCGGFIKSHVPIDFSKVEVKLLTKQGILKDKINCAPNNGYYFVPLYDKGDYVLELEPPPGWSFTPTKVEITVDGVTDLCSQGKDIDFIFKGFGITGRVESLGGHNGPKAVEVELESNTETRKTLTGANGNFFFTPVYPGTHTLRIINSKWKVAKDSVSVVVTEGNTELPAKSLVIQGYDVTGHVKNEGEPIKDTVVALYTKQNADKVQVDGCSKEPLPGVSNKNQLVCHVRTSENGIFTFPTVPIGKYFVKPFYGTQNIYYQPELIEFVVNPDSVKLPINFEIVGFSISGRVLKSPKGEPISGAKVYLNGVVIAKTDSSGTYKLEKLKAGVYNLNAEYDGFLFKETSVRLNPDPDLLPDLVPSSYRVCGNVVSDESQTITFSQVGSTKIYTVQSDPGNGQFCEFLSPGNYQVQVIVNSQDTQKGLQFFPKVQTIEVTSNRVAPISFSQLKARVTGRIKCLLNADCADLTAILKPLGDFSDTDEIVVRISENSYRVDDVYPGTYEVTLSSNKLCWKENKQIININSVNIEVPTFVQIGYSIVFISSHDTKLIYNSPGQNKVSTINVNKGRLAYCLEKSGAYTFKIDSCHSYESNGFTYETSSETNEIYLNAIKHTTTLYIASDRDVGEVLASVAIDSVMLQVGPLPFTKDGYKINLLLAPTEVATVIPYSKSLYFNPVSVRVTGGLDCVNLGSQFKGVMGLVFKGRIIPPLPGVIVTVTFDHEKITRETDSNGTYQFPPLDRAKSYKITAKKESYALVGPNTSGDFMARKLAEIVIEVLDTVDKSPLQGTLLSLSGGESYRSNLQTGENGMITFNSLSPGEYFLRPMMKEYSFEPNSKIISVEEGATVNVQLTGRRVAYSAYGQITSLNGEPEDGVTVVALGIGNCSHLSEEATSEPNGLFRVRGLQPYCKYEIRANGGRTPIERSVPDFVHTERVTSDVTGIKIIIFRPTTIVELLVRVHAKNPEHYKSLKMKVARESPPMGIVYTGRVDTGSITINSDYNSGYLVQIPSIPLDNNIYSIQLDTSLNYKIDNSPQLFTANMSFKYIELNFIIKSNIGDQDIKQTSVWTLVFLFIVILILYNIGKVSHIFKDRFGHYFIDFMSVAGKKPIVNEYPVDNDDIDQIVQSINAVKKKPKPKKL